MHNHIYLMTLKYQCSFSNTQSGSLICNLKLSELPIWSPAKQNVFQVNKPFLKDRFPRLNSLCVAWKSLRHDRKLQPLLLVTHIVNVQQDHRKICLFVWRGKITVSIGKSKIKDRNPLYITKLIKTRVDQLSVLKGPFFNLWNKLLFRYIGICVDKDKQWGI